MKLPVFELIMSGEESGVQAVALVDAPAIGIGYQAFNEAKAKMKFEIADEDERVIMGAAMIPDLPIYRNDKMGEYMAIFKKETIKNLVQKFFQEYRQNQFNKHHDSKNGQLEGLTIFQSFITSEKMGISAPKGYENIADGTWFIAAKVEDEAIWNDIKNGEEFKGFSIEGMFDIQPYKQALTTQEKLIQEFTEIVNKHFNIDE